MINRYSDIAKSSYLRNVINDIYRNDVTSYQILFYGDGRSVKNVYRKLNDGLVKNHEPEKYSHSGRSNKNIRLVRATIIDEPQMFISRRL